LELVAKRGRALVDAASSMVLLAVDADRLSVSEVAGNLDRSLVGTIVEDADSRALDVFRSGRSQRYRGGPPAEYADFGAALDSGLIVALRSRGTDLGVLSVFDPLGGEGGFTSDDELALESFATSAASAIAATQALEDEKLRLSIASSERERTRWARELHDETLQELGALGLMQESAMRSEDPAKMRTALDRSSEQVERISDGLRGLIAELRPAALDQLGVEAALEALVERTRLRSGLTIDVDVDLDYEQGREANRHPSALEATIYRTVQEALNNAVKHADAANVRILVEERGDLIRVLVEDDGRGFNPRAGHEGFGLLGMRERISIAGGDLAIGTGSQGGTRLDVKLPVDRS